MRYNNNIIYIIYIHIAADILFQMIDSKYPSDQFVRYGEVELTLLEHSPKPFFQSSLTISCLTTLSKNLRGSFISSTTVSTMGKKEYMYDYNYEIPVHVVLCLLSPIYAVETRL